MKSGIIGAVVIGALAMFTTILKLRVISSQVLVDIVGIIMFTAFGFYVGKLREKAKK